MSGCASSRRPLTRTLPTTTSSRGKGDTSAGPLRHCGEDCLNDSVEIFHDLVVPKAKDTIALFGKIRGAFSVPTKP